MLLTLPASWFFSLEMSKVAAAASWFSSMSRYRESSSKPRDEETGQSNATHSSSAPRNSASEELQVGHNSTLRVPPRRLKDERNRDPTTIPHIRPQNLKQMHRKHRIISHPLPVPAQPDTQGNEWRQGRTAPNWTSIPLMVYQRQNHRPTPALSSS